MRLILDAGAFIAVERLNVQVDRRLAAARLREVPLVTSAIVVAQVWSDGKGRQAVLARLLNSVDVHPVDLRAAKRAGDLCRRAGTSDPIDASLVLLAHHGDEILTSDPQDIYHLALEAHLNVRVIGC